MSTPQKLLGVLRITLGWIFLWPFFDKLFGLGFATAPEKAWLAGGSPTTGFLTFGTRGPFSEIFQALAGSTVVDWFFMVGLLCIGTALIFGIAMRLATFSGMTMLLFMWLAALLPEHNPVVDDHVVYSIVLLYLLLSRADQYVGFGRKWKGLSIVRRISLLK